MKITFSILSFMSLNSVLAADPCLVFVPEKSYLHSSGYEIRFNFRPLLESKGYSETSNTENATHFLLMKGEEVEGRIHRARASFTFQDLTITKERSCLTQWCGIADYGAVFKKAYRTLAREIPPCR